MKSTSLWIAALTFTAVILSAIMLANNERQAQASMLNAQPNVTMMTTGTNGGDEGLVIVDKAQQKMIVYMINNNALVPVAGRRLN